MSQSFLVVSGGILQPTYIRIPLLAPQTEEDSDTDKQQLTSELGAEWSIDFYIFVHQTSITKYLSCVPYFLTNRCKIVKQ